MLMAPALLVLCSPSSRPVAMETLFLPFCYWVRHIRDYGCFSAPWGLECFSLPLAQTEKSCKRMTTCNIYHSKFERVFAVIHLNDIDIVVFDILDSF